MEEKKKRPRISYSQMSKWINCSEFHRITHVDKLFKEPTNYHLAFGSSIHTLSENILGTLTQDPRPTFNDYHNFFLETYNQELQKLPEPVEDDILRDHIRSSKIMIQQYEKLLTDTIGEFEVVFVEKEINHEMKTDKDFEFDFIGYIDFVLKDKQGNIYICDLKTAKRPWGWKKRRDKKYINQLIAYKFFYEKEFKVGYENIKTMYAFLYPDKDMEVLFIDSTTEKIEEMLEDMRRMVLNAWVIKNYARNPNCQFCGCKKFEQWSKENDQQDS